MKSMRTGRPTKLIPNVPSSEIPSGQTIIVSDLVADAMGHSGRPILKCGRMTLYRGIGDGTFPAPTRVMSTRGREPGGRLLAWPSWVIKKWVAEYEQAQEKAPEKARKVVRERLAKLRAESDKKVESIMEKLDEVSL
jgi:predicted DNA-binding transcriptional regulator AlpA